MFRDTPVRHFATATAAVVTVALIVLLPVAVILWFAPSIFSGASVQGAPRDAFVVSTPVRLSNAPGVVLRGGWVYDTDGTISDATARLVFEAPIVTISASPSASPTEGLEETLPIILAQLSTLSFDSLQIRRGRIEITSQGGGTEALSDVGALITSNRKGNFTAKGTATYRGNTVAFDTQWSVPADKKAAQRLPIKLNLKSDTLSAAIEGRLTTNEGLRLQAAADVHLLKVKQLARSFGIALPGSGEPKGGARIKGTLDWGAGTLTFSRATFSTDGNEGTGALALDTTKAVPSLDGTLAFEVFDLTPYVGIAPSIASIWPLGLGAFEEDLTPSFLTRIDADLRMSAGKITVPYLQTGRGAATISLKNGRMLADIAELELESGTFGGQLTAEVASDGPRYELRGKVENVDVGRSLSGLLHRNPLQGRSNINVELTGRGNEVRELLGSLSGKADFTLSDAGRLGLDLRALMYAAQRSEVKGWAAAGKGQTALEQLEAQLSVRNGIITTEALNAKSAGLAISGSGHINIVRQLLDMKLKFSNATSGERAALADEALLLRGGWAEPQIRVERQQRAQAPR
jgi:AsmA protein